MVTHNIHCVKTLSFNHATKKLNQKNEKPLCHNRRLFTIKHSVWAPKTFLSDCNTRQTSMKSNIRLRGTNQWVDESAEKGALGSQLLGRSRLRAEPTAACGRARFSQSTSNVPVDSVAWWQSVRGASAAAGHMLAGSCLWNLGGPSEGRKKTATEVENTKEPTAFSGSLRADSEGGSGGFEGEWFSRGVLTLTSLEECSLLVLKSEMQCLLPVYLAVLCCAHHFLQYMSCLCTDRRLWQVFPLLK